MIADSDVKVFSAQEELVQVMILMCVSMYNASTAIVSNFCSEKSGSCSPDCFQALAVLKEAAIVDLPSQAVNCSCDGMTS